MRTMLRISMSTEASNRALKEGLIPKLVQQTLETIKPEASYFTADGGQRTVYFFFDMRESSQMPQIAEPWFAATNALVEFQPVMSAEELRAGLEKIGK